MNASSFNKVSFIKSISNLEQRPDQDLPEIAFIGRSNVGKSSLLNAICGRKSMAKVSATPGKTKLINYFLVNQSYHFVDLPGYGYAKIPKRILETLGKMIEQYLLNSELLKLICLLIDSRHKTMDIDKQMIEWLDHNNLNFILILTKTDKIAKSKLQEQLSYYQTNFPDKEIFAFSIKSENLKRELVHFLINYQI